MNRVKLVLWIFFTFFIVESCKQKETKVKQEETLEAGTAKFAADESFQPIVDDEAYVFKQLNSKANPVIVYKPENDALRLLLTDSVRLAFLTRGLDTDEIKILASRKLTPEVNRIAIDAVVLIVNQASNDTLITVNELKKLLSGQTKTTKNIVFDNPNSSLVRYLKTFAGVNDIKQKNIYSLSNNKEVIKFVSQNANAIGIIGYNWLDDDPNSDYVDAVKKIKVVSVKDENSKTEPTKYFAPSQNTIATKQYPLIRGLYVVNCTGKLGLGTGFVHFLLSERGQRVILRSNLWPDNVPPREIHIKHKY
jgi:phosphate transport system substrate-binding protein